MGQAVNCGSCFTICRLVSYRHRHYRQYEAERWDKLSTAAPVLLSEGWCLIAIDITGSVRQRGGTSCQLRLPFYYLMAGVLSP